MAKKKENSKTIQNIELTPEVIGSVKKKKNNTGRVIIIFIAFLVAIIYLPELSIILNNTFGLHSSPTLNDHKDPGNKDDKNNSNVENEMVYNEINNDLVINIDDIILKNFQISNNILSFTIINETDRSKDLTKNNYYLETYSDSKTLLERFKVDIGILGIKKSENISLNILKDNISFISFVKKKASDYPVYEPKKDELGYGTITCQKDYRTLNYTFKNNELIKIKDEIVKNFKVEDITYNDVFTKYQTKCTNYDLIDGVNAAFNSSVNGFTAAIEIDLDKALLDTLDDKLYYSYKSIPKVIYFELQTYGYTCS